VIKVAGESNSSPEDRRIRGADAGPDYAAKSLASADEVLEQAQLDARKKQTYLERVVAPNLPTGPSAPAGLFSADRVRQRTDRLCDDHAGHGRLREHRSRKSMLQVPILRRATRANTARGGCSAA